MTKDALVEVLRVGPNFYHGNIDGKITCADASNIYTSYVLDVIIPILNTLGGDSVVSTISNSSNSKVGRNIR